STISLFLKPHHKPEKIANKLCLPESLATHTINGMISYTPIAGICATYAGYITTSDYNGEIIFPRKHQSPIINVLVTTAIEPIPLFENTISHWNLLADVPVAMYEYEEKYDKEKDEHFWETKRVDIPADKKIPLNTIILIAKPTNIFIPLEKTTTT